MSREHNQRPQGETGATEFTLDYHREMLMDRRRVRAFQRGIALHGRPDRTFLEIGPGTGVMSAFAAQHYGRVIAVERDARIHAVARQNLERLGLLSKNVTLLHADGLAEPLPKADVIMGELLSTLMIHEPQVPVFNRARAALAAGGAMIPGRVINLAQLAWSKSTAHGVSLSSPYSLFTGVPPPERVGPEEVFFVADFQAGEVPLAVAATVALRAAMESTVNALVLTSWVQVAPGITFSGSDSLNPPMVVPIAPLDVRPGDVVDVSIRYQHFTDWNTFEARAVRRD
jgi:predicted RNA methylase